MDGDEEPTRCPFHSTPHYPCPLCHRRSQAQARSQLIEQVERHRAAIRSRRAIVHSRKTPTAETSQSSAEIHRPSEEEGSTIRPTAKSRRKEAADTTPSQLSAEIHRPSEEGASTMAEVDASLHEEELSDWMSQLFEKLDSEANEDNMSSEIHSSLKGKDSTMVKVDIGGLHEEDQLSDWMSQLFEKLDLEANKDDDLTGNVAHSTSNIAQGETHCLLEGGISSEIHRSSEEKDSTMDKLNFGSLYDDDKFVDWMIDVLKLRGYEDDVCSLPEVDQEEEYPIQDDVPDKFNDNIDEEANDNCKRMKKVSYKKTIENGIKWMSEECFLAFKKSAENFHFEGIEHRFGELRSQCFSVEAYDKIFHHYNFTIDEKHGSSDVWTSKLYFAEVKQLSHRKSYLCCLLEPNDCGHCYGCKSQDMSDLKHPSRGGYEEGDAGICSPFMDDPEYDSSSGDDYDHIC